VKPLHVTLVCALWLSMWPLAEQRAAQTLSPDDAGGRAELAALSSLLSAWAEQPDWPHVDRPEHAAGLSVLLDGDPTPAISTRLALFRTRFGLGFRECPGWPEFAALAGRIHARLVVEYPQPQDPAQRDSAQRDPEHPGSEQPDAQHPAPREPAERVQPAPALSDSWNAPGWLGVRALLLDISGQSDEARHLLFGDGVARYWPGCCPYCSSESLFHLARSRAELLDRHGDQAGALRWLHEAYFQCEADQEAEMFGRPRVASDLMKARYALLLAEAGEFAAAAGVVSALAASDSGSLGLQVAQTALADRLQAAAPSDVRVFGLQLSDGAEGLCFGAGMAFVVGDEHDAADWRLVACRLPKYPERRLSNRHQPDHGTDLEIVAPTDPRVLPLILTSVAQPSGFMWSPGLLALHALDGSARSRLEACLQQTDVEHPLNWGFGSSRAIDRAARLLCGDGPALPRDANEMPTAEVRDAWLAWLK